MHFQINLHWVVLKHVSPLLFFFLQIVAKGVLIWMNDLTPFSSHLVLIEMLSLSPNFPKVLQNAVAITRVSFSKNIRQYLQPRMNTQNVFVLLVEKCFIRLRTLGIRYWTGQIHLAINRSEDVNMIENIRVCIHLSNLFANTICILLNAVCGCQGGQ